jgi:M6 family metalloprotease-like protein
MPTPFSGKIFTFINPDGSEFQVRGWGNQYAARFETLDGFTVVKDPASGYYQYARLSDDKNTLLPTGVNVGDADPQGLGLPLSTRVRRDAAKSQAESAKAKDTTPRRWEVRRAQKKTETGRAEALSVSGDPGTAPPPGTTVGTYVGLCVLIDFPDVPGTISQGEVNNYCNQVGYSGFGNNGSVRDYFHEVSDGSLTYTSVVTAYYTAANNRSHYTDPTISFGTRARELITEALDALVAQGFDFSPLSSDGGGFIYALNVFYAGPVVNNWSEGLWPHSWSLASVYPVSGGKKFFDYQFTDMSNELTLRTFCHENGHMICDFPDLYDYGGESAGPGHFCLMGYGGPDKNPVHVGAYLKNAAGWATSLTAMTSGMNASVSAGQNDFYIYSKNQSEYFIIENRQQSGRDAALPDNGLAIWHIDEAGSNNNEQMTAVSHYECSLEQADNRFDLEHNANAGDGEDLFASPHAVSFNDGSTPNSHWWNGSASGLAISQISVSGATMTFSVGGTATAQFDVAPSISLLLDLT